MPRCPNCGQPTSRTKDWACQWCGYPLMSKFFREIPKTYEELKAEGLGKPAVVEVEKEAEAVAEVEVEAEPEVKEAEAEVKVEEEVKAEEVPEVKEVVEAEVVEEAKPEKKPKPKAKRKKKVEPKPKEKAKPKPKAKAKKSVKPKAEPEAKAEEEAVEEVPAEPESKAEEEAVEEAKAEPEAKTEEEVKIPKPKLVADAIPASVDEMYAEFNEDSAAAEAKFAGKFVNVTGVVNIVAVDDVIDNPCLILTGSDITALRNVVCSFEPKYKPLLNKMETGKTVTVQGRYDSRTINVILLVDCVLVD